MARKYIPMSDLNTTGLQEDMSPMAKLWKVLENVRRGTGGWVKRPGTDRIGTTLPVTTSGIPKLIATIKTPLSQPTSEVITPTGMGNYNQWTPLAGTAWEAVDEVTPDDDVTYIEEATLGEKVSFVFSDLTGTWNRITSLRIKIRAKQQATISQKLLVSVRIAGTDYLLPNGTLTVGTGSSYIDLTVDSSSNPATALPWTQADVADLEVILEKGTGTVPTTETLNCSPASVTLTTLNQYKNVTAPVSAVTWASAPQTAVMITTAANTSFIVVRVRAGLGTGEGNFTIGDIIANGAAYVQPVVLTAPFTDGTVTFTVSFAEIATSTGAGISEALSSLRVRRVGSTANETGTIRITRVSATVEGDGSAGRKQHLLLLNSKAFLRVSEDLATYEDLTGTLDITQSEGAVWDWTTFGAKAIVTNGSDQMYEYDASTGTFAQNSGLPVGACLAAYGSRLCLGDVVENGVRSDQRFRWSAITNTQVWDTVEAGNLELNETAGKIVKLKPLVEQSDALVGVLVAYKSRGIYHIAPKTLAADPFAKKLMDSSAGCLARGSVVGFSDKNGREAHAFLGTVGNTLNVMSWNGASVQQFGWGIVPILNSIGDQVNMEKAIAEVDGFGNYILLFPTTDSTFLKTAVVYNFNHQVWSVWKLNNVTAIGSWDPRTGKPVTVIGRPDGFVYKLDDALSADDIEAQDSVAIAHTMTTGDIVLGQPGGTSTLERVWLYYQEGTTPSGWGLDITNDGGDSYRVDESNLTRSFNLDGNSANAGVKLARVDCRSTGRLHGIRFKSNLADGKPQMLQLLLEVEEAGIVP